jgi:hypothetical protein
MRGTTTAVATALAPVLLDGVGGCTVTENQEAIRDQAVRNVDARYGYTCEHSASPDAHRQEYDDEEARLTRAATLAKVNLILRRAAQ